MTANVSQPSANTLFNPVLIAGCLIILVGFAIRSSFGLFQIPVPRRLAGYGLISLLPLRCKICSGV